jgi:hypothetical protein
MVRHWLAFEAQPMGAPLGRLIKEVQTFTDDTGAPAYYVVYLNPAGLVFVAADDLVEPIIGFLPDGLYDPSTTNPLGALVSKDIPDRVRKARESEVMTPEALPAHQAAAREKWASLQVNAASGQTISASSLLALSDVRVPPFVQTRWSQSTVISQACYNYFTPPYAIGSASNYYCGCVATVMAQLLRFWQYPTAGVGTGAFQISVAGISQSADLRGGDGAGGPYNWANMVLDPQNSIITDTQRQAIGNLTYDCGVAVNMSYNASGSGAGAGVPVSALVSTFKYSNAKFGFNSGINLPDTNRNAMVNPNLQAQYPVLLTITGPSGGHEIITDGYGYSSSTMYHHLNMGWGGFDDAWYNLPNIAASPYNFNTIYACVYNIYVSGSGEIIAGRVTTAAGNPLSGVTVTATGGGKTYNAVAPTTSSGVYAIPKVPSGTSFTVSASLTGHIFTPRTVNTGTSATNTTTTGNLWGVDFVDGTSTRHGHGHH